MKSRSFQIQAFTVTELLVVTAAVSILTGVMLPCLGRARRQCRATICWSNIRQLYIANSGYSLENDDFYVRAAYDYFEGFGGRHRWHGVRKSDGVAPDPAKNTFDPLKGPLKNYLSDGEVKECPALVKFIKDGAMNAFEAGCGGYGYNAIGIGSRSYQYGFCDRAVRSSMKTVEISRPDRKVMFTDTAFTQGSPPSYIIEYSFCEPPRAVMNFGNGPRETGRLKASIHFRHLGKTNVVWCDGHITAESIDFPPQAIEQIEEFKIGWFGPDDNSLFRPN